MSTHVRQRRTSNPIDGGFLSIDPNKLLRDPFFENTWHD